MNPVRDKTHDREQSRNRFFETNHRLSRGAVLVEFALILPVMLMLILGIIEASWALYVKNTLTDVARHGTRIISTQNVTNDYVTDQMESLLQAANVPVSSVSFTFTPNAPSLQAKGTPLTITATVPYSSISILPTSLFLGSVTLESAVTMVKEY